MNTENKTTQTPSAAADKTAHTPGPWHTMENYKGGIPLSVASHHSEFGTVTVARVDWLPNGRPSETCRANARLIAAAPTMLQALKDLTAQIQLGKLSIRKDFSLMNAHAAATKAIFQAEGEQSCQH